jgi:homoserine O-acetyltransferase
MMFGSFEKWPDCFTFTLIASFSRRLHKIILDQLGVASVAVVVGGSMGGMTTLEWPLCTPTGYVRHIIPIATSARHSAWCISWGEAQRQSIYSDPLYLDGYYDVVNGQPKTGLAAARMAALLTYRCRDSFESRFGRKTQLKSRSASDGGVLTPPESPRTPADHALALHNDGHRGSQRRLSSAVAGTPSAQSSTNPQPQSATNSESATDSQEQPPPPIFAAQSYLRYQGDKFTARFDANCYIHISRKLDTHDLARDRITLPSSHTPEDEIEALHNALSMLPSGALVISIQTDGLFTPSEQQEIASYIPEASLVTIPSPDGHDGFLLEFEAINRHILEFLNGRLPELYTGAPADPAAIQCEGESFEINKTSMFGEAEADITRW